MARNYKGTVSIIKNTKNEITIKADPDGKFSSDNVVELYKTMLNFGKKLKCTVKFFQPDSAGKVPVLLYKFENSPFLALMKELPESQKPGRATVTKLA